MDSDIFEPRRDRMTEPKRRGAPKWLIPLIVVILLVVGGVGAYMAMGNKSTPKNTTSVSPTTEPTEEPTPTEEAVDLKAYKIMVLNGTAVAGEAGKLKTALEAEGFQVSGTANADKKTYTKAIIQAKESVKAGFISKLKTEVEKTYEVGTDETLKDDDENDVVVIIGISDDKQKEASDSASKDTPTPEETKEPTSTKAE